MGTRSPRPGAAGAAAASLRGQAPGLASPAAERRRRSRRGRPRAPSPHTPGLLSGRPRRKFRSLTEPCGSNSGGGGGRPGGAGIWDADALRAACRVGSVGARPGARSQGAASGGAGVRDRQPLRPAPLLRLSGEVGDLPPCWPASEETLIFPPPRLRDSGIEASEEGKGTVHNSWDLARLPCGSGRPRWSISLRCRNGRSHLASCLPCCLPDPPLGMKSLVITP